MTFATISLAAPLSAQQRSTVSTATLDAAVASGPTNDRAVVAAALSSVTARAAAGKLGMSADAVNARVAALDDASAKMLADRALAGGSTVVIGTTTIIIILLILILVA